MSEWRGIEEEAEALITENGPCGKCDCCHAHRVNLEEPHRRAQAHAVRAAAEQIAIGIPPGGLEILAGGIERDEVEV